MIEIMQWHFLKKEKWYLTLLKQQLFSLTLRDCSKKTKESDQVNQFFYSMSYRTYIKDTENYQNQKKYLRYVLKIKKTAKNVYN